MYHYYNAITNTRGDSLPGYYVRAVNTSDNSVATIYADASGTPISTVSEVVNMALTDSEGNVSFYIDSGNYHVDIYSGDQTTLIKRVPDVPMTIANVSDTLGTSTSTAPSQRAVTDALTAKADTSALAAKVDTSTITGTSGAATVGRSGGRTVESSLVRLEGSDIGVVPSGSTQGIVVDRAFTGASDGTAVVYGEVHRLEAKGANAINMARTNYNGLDITASGDVFVGTGEHRYVWAKGTGTVTYARVFEGHIRVDSPASIGTAYVFNTVGVTLTGGVTQIVGYNAGTLGDSTYVVQAYCFNANDQPACADKTIAFRSEMTKGSGGKFAFAGVGDAPSFMGGSLKVGQATQASNALHVYSVDADFSSRFENAHASTPWGIRIFLSAAAPNNTTQQFIRCEDSSTTRMAVYSNGNIVNSNNSYGAISDIRLKTDVAPAASVLDRFRAREFITYRLLGDDGGTLLRGVSAQSELLNAPELVTEGSDGHFSYNYAGLSVETGQGLKELLAIVDDLRARVVALEG